MKDYSINWEEQWANFAEDFHDGKAHINLEPFGGTSTLELIPGPGFGDLSHETTYLMLQLMSEQMKNRTILDIGCGSGILTLAALLLGAKSAHGIDIDPQAITHAEQNNTQNNLNATFSLSLPTQKYDLALMNMITSEQETVLKNPIEADLWITSGILLEQREEYLTAAKARGWKLIKQAKKNNWIALLFRT